MSLKLRGLRLTAITSEGPYGATLLFGDGLNVLRAGNTSGKSTAVQAIVYALGLEPMLTSKYEVPLPHAMKEALTTEDEQEIAVLESHVLLEVENREGSVVTIQRWVKHETIKTNLVAVWSGALIREDGEGIDRRDFYVRLAGSARSEVGFHDWLRKFIGWDAATIIKNDGTEVPLYLELVFPLIFVEQKHGWSGIQAQTPHYGGLLEPKKRAREFLLALDVYNGARDRQLLRQEQQQIVAAWAAAEGTFTATLERLGVVLKGVPQEPSMEWPLIVQPTLTIAGTEGWRTVDELIEELEGQLRELIGSDIPSAEQVSGEMAQRLAAAEKELNLLGAAIAQAEEEEQFEEESLRALDGRLAALAEDRRRHEDVMKLRRLGSTQGLRKLEQECPTCHQPVPEVLLSGSEQAWTSMSIAENIQFIDQQVETFRGIRDEVVSALAAKRVRITALRERSGELKREIRALKNTLTSASDMPSVATVRRQVLLEERLGFLRRLEADLGGFLMALGNLANRYFNVRRALDTLPEQGLTESDERKLNFVERSFTDQLREYGFRSFSIDLLSISRASYLPAREGFDLGFDLSASDWIRVIWAYLLAILEVARYRSTNHPGLLIFDEPRQQAAETLSFAALLPRAATSARFDQQVIFATSEPEESILEMLSEIPHVYLTYSGRLLRRVPSVEE